MSIHFRKEERWEFCHTRGRLLCEDDEGQTFLSNVGSGDVTYFSGPARWETRRPALINIGFDVVVAVRWRDHASYGPEWLVIEEMITHPEIGSNPGDF